MTVPTLPSRWGELLTSAGLLLILTATVATGQGVTQCGDQLCGYRAECNPDTGHCGCPFTYGVLTELKDTPPSVWYCVVGCNEGSSSCPDNTTCTDLSDDNVYLCYCSGGATLSSTGQCLLSGNARASPEESIAHDTIEGTSPTQVSTLESGLSPKEGDPSNHKENNKGGDSRTLFIGLGAGIGGAVLLAVVLVVLLVIALRRKRKRRDDNVADSRRQPQPPHNSSVHNSNRYESVVDPIPGLSATDNPAGPTIIVRTEVSVIGHGDKRETDIRKERYSNHAIPANKAQKANNLIRQISLSENKAKPKNVNELCSNDTIPFNKAQQGKKNNQEPSESMPNQYNTLYDLTPASGNGGGFHPQEIESGNTDAGIAEYSATYSTVGARGNNIQPAGAAHRGDLEYDELKLQKV